uniref:Uncharacterized protein n=1 Tax=Megaselia scalaris TaxID=36166 RepID=T1GQW4_MEGSC
MSSGTVGAENHQDTNALPDLPTIVKLVSACGLIKFQNAKTKVGLLFLVKWFDMADSTYSAADVKYRTADPLGKIGH